MDDGSNIASSHAVEHEARPPLVENRDRQTDTQRQRERTPQRIGLDAQSTEPHPRPHELHSLLLLVLFVVLLVLLFLLFVTV